MINITTSQVTGLGWKRGVEDRYPSVNDASLKWGAYDMALDGEVVSGMVAGIRKGTGNEVVLCGAGSGTRGEEVPGAFHGIFFTEFSRELDEKAGGAPPSVIVGPALLFIRSRALKKGAPYSATGLTSYLVASTETEHKGKLVPATVSSGAITNAANSIVGKVQEVHPDGILMRLNVPTV